MAALYYLEASERLNRGLERQLLVIMFAILIVVVALSDWRGATV
jgi:hypothetical protein